MKKIQPKIDSNSILYRLAIMARRWRQILDTEFIDAGLTDATWRPLLHLHILGDMIRQKDLAASIGIEGPSIVRLLDSLINKGFVQRMEDPNDRRSKLIGLTEEGRMVVEGIQEAVASLERDLFIDFTDEDISKFTQFVVSLESRVNGLKKRNRK